MNDKELQSFLKGEFKAECFRIELKREGANPLHFSGPGIIEQDKNYVLNFRLHIDQETIKALVADLNRPREMGKIIAHEEYFNFTAYTYNLPVWNAEIAAIGCTMGLSNGGIAFGLLPEMFKIFDQLPNECIKDSARLVAREAIEFPETAVTETEVKRGGKMRRKDSSRDHAAFMLHEEKFELSKLDNGTELSCVFDKGGINDNKHVRIQEAMQFALGQQFQPCVLKLTSGKTEVTVLRSTAFRGDRKVRQNPPLIFKGKAWTPAAYEIAKAFYSKICEHKEEKWHPVSSHVYYLLQAGSAAVELQCLALGVAAEGIADTCHESLADVSDEFKKEVDEALAKIALLGFSESLSNRVSGAVINMKQARGSDRIRAFVVNNNFDQGIFKSWQRVRNAAAHGGRLESSSIEKTLSDLNNVLHLCYAMLLSFASYQGVRTDYSTPGQPDVTP
jgi:hypothetical protein